MTAQQEAGTRGSSGHGARVGSYPPTGENGPTSSVDMTKMTDQHFSDFFIGFMRRQGVDFSLLGKRTTPDGGHDENESDSEPMVERHGALTEAHTPLRSRGNSHGGMKRLGTATAGRSSNAISNPLDVLFLILKFRNGILSIKTPALGWDNQELY